MMVSTRMGEHVPSTTKRLRCMYQWPVDSLCHSDWLRAAEGLTVSPNYLQQLYPHCKDDACILDEVEHVYYVNGVAIKYSASDVVHAFFPQFNKDLSYQLLDKSLRNLHCSVYWLYMYLVLIEGLGGQEEAFVLRVDVVFEKACEDCSTRAGSSGWDLCQARETESQGLRCVGCIRVH